MAASQFGSPTHRCPRCKTDVILKKGEVPPTCGNCGGPLLSVVIDEQLQREMDPVTTESRAIH